MKTNFLLITVDDMNYNSVDFLKQPDKKQVLMPNLCQLMKEGMTFENSHVAIALCQPSRSVLMTGKYPHCNGARGFEPISSDITTLTKILKENGYFNGIIGKENHISPRESFCWDVYESTYHEEGDFGRCPQLYYEHTKKFLKQADDTNAPFFLMANSHDPHRPFAGSDGEYEMFGRQISYEEVVTEDDVQVPNFLPDLPDIRKEFAQYLNSVHRADQSIGGILKALIEAGHEDDTMILFLSDNGMSMPFAKANCYLNSTKSPYVVKWKHQIEPGTVSDALISSIDYMPTILEMIGASCPEGLDGKSFVHILKNDKREQYQNIYTSFYKTAKNKTTKKELQFPMRCVQDKQYAYIYNAWSGGENQYRTETMSGLSFRAMKEAAQTDDKIAGRVNFYLNRVKEELYDYKKDPHALCNLAEQPEYHVMMTAFRKSMHQYMEESKDELLEKFTNDIKMED